MVQPTDADRELLYLPQAEEDHGAPFIGFLLLKKWKAMRLSRRPGRAAKARISNSALTHRMQKETLR
jgi:hypothetical protein